MFFKFKKHKFLVYFLIILIFYILSFTVNLACISETVWGTVSKHKKSLKKETTKKTITGKNKKSNRQHFGKLKTIIKFDNKRS